MKIFIAIVRSIFINKFIDDFKQRFGIHFWTHSIFTDCCFCTIVQKSRKDKNETILTWKFICCKQLHLAVLKRGSRPAFFEPYSRAFFISNTGASLSWLSWKSHDISILSCWAAKRSMFEIPTISHISILLKNCLVIAVTHKNKVKTRRMAHVPAFKLILNLA